jgi:hypothetical protein
MTFFHIQQTKTGHQKYVHSYATGDITEISDKCIFNLGSN